MSGLLLWPGLGSPLGELSRRGLKILGAFTEGNCLKGLDKKNWLLGMGDLSITYGLYSLLGCIKVLAFTRLSRTRRLAFLSWFLGRSYCQDSSRTSNLNLFRSILNLRAGGGSFPNGRGLVHMLHLPQVE